MGDALQCFEQSRLGLAQYDIEEHRTRAFRTGVDTGVTHQCYLAWSLWLLGYGDAASARMTEGVALAERLAFAHTVAYALAIETFLRNQLGDFGTAKHRAVACITLCRDHGFASWLAWGTMQLGLAHCGLGELVTGIDVFKEGMLGWRRTGAKADIPCFQIGLAEASIRAGRLGDAAQALEEADSVLNEGDERFYQSELYRMHGLLALARNPASIGCANDYFEKGLDIARKQLARPLELRLAVSRFRMLSSHGAGSHVRGELLGVYRTFTEGFGTGDLVEARACLSVPTGDTDT